MGNASCADGAAAFLISTDSGKATPYPEVVDFGSFLDSDHLDKEGLSSEKASYESLSHLPSGELASPLIAGAVYPLLGRNGLAHGRNIEEDAVQFRVGHENPSEQRALPASHIHYRREALAYPFITADGLAGRCATVAGDFFRSVPRGADVYILKNVIHDWDDDRSATILRNCQRALARNGRVLVVETLMSPDGNRFFASLMDLHMLVILDGREREEAEYRGLFDRAGLKLTEIIPTLFPLSLIEGAPK